jgi:peptidoglycan/xylan/chitin deacetylase (PgdA/CDA1 family)
MKKLLAISCLLLGSCMTIGQSPSDALWHGKKCAVVITYDDAISQHLDNALPVLDSLQLKATFYVTANGAKDRIADWKKLAAKGHELGNHTLFHPCVGGPGREWVSPDRDMNNYTVQRMVDEIRMTNVFLEALDGKKKRTFAYTCGDMKVHDTAFMDQLKNDFVAARGVSSQQHTIYQVDLYNTDCYGVNGETAAQMEQWVQQAMASHSLLVVLFHGVGGGNSLNVSLPAHREFLSYLKLHENELWIAPMIEVAEYIKGVQAQKK